MAFVVFAGQSNTGGAYMTASTVPEAWRPDPKTLMWDAAANTWTPMDPGLNTGFGGMPDAWGPEVAFAIAFRAAHPDEPLHIVKSAWGGTRLEVDPAQWAYDWSPRSADELFARTTNTVDAASVALGGARPDAVFWGQGEEDANHAAAAGRYAENLAELFAAIRAEWMNDPEGKIGFYRISGTPAFGAEVRHAELMVDQADGHADSFDSKPFPLLADGVHFSAEGHQLSGAAFFELYRQWLAGGPPGEETAGQVLTSAEPGDALVGGQGADTLNASQGSDVLTGGGGGDVFAWAREPWSPARVTDFRVGEDRLDLSALFHAAGANPAQAEAAGHILLLDDGRGGTQVLFDDDGRGEGADWPNYILHLEGVAAAGLTWAMLAGAGAPPPPPPEEPPPGSPPGLVLTSAGPGDLLAGGAGDDTLQSSAGRDVLTGGAGADRFVFGVEPWDPPHITDFEPGVDVIDLSALFRAVGYAGSDPFADGYLKLIGDGSGGTAVLFDRDAAGPAPEWANYIIDVEGVSPGRLGPGDFLFQ